MVIWVIILSIITIFSYLSDTGILSFLQKLRVPVINASLTSLLLLVVTFVMLARLLVKIKSREREAMGTKITQLERELEAFKREVGP